MLLLFENIWLGLPEKICLLLIFIISVGWNYNNRNTLFCDRAERRPVCSSYLLHSVEISTVHVFLSLPSLLSVTRICGYQWKDIVFKYTSTEIVFFLLVANPFSICIFCFCKLSLNCNEMLAMKYLF